MVYNMAVDGTPGSDGGSSDVRIQVLAMYEQADIRAKHMIADLQQMISQVSGSGIASRELTLQRVNPRQPLLNFAQLFSA